MTKRIFIDGAAGAVGSCLQEYLQRESITPLILEDTLRKDITARKEMMAAADIIVLCLRDEHAKDAINLAKVASPCAQIIDTSAINRCNQDWLYALTPFCTQEQLKNASLIANPGCFATGCLLMVKPLAHMYKEPPFITFNGTTGYSAKGANAVASELTLVRIGKAHRHDAEIMKHGGVVSSLSTSVGSWKQGMLIQCEVPLAFNLTLEELKNTYSNTDIKVSTAEACSSLEVTSCNDTNNAHLVVCENKRGWTSMAVVLDNLGKGAAGNVADILKTISI